MTFRWLESPAVTRIVERAAWGLVAGGMWLVVAPAGIPAGAGQSPATAPGAVAPPVRAASGASWLDGNPFSVSRRAPARRWLANDTSSVEPESGIAAATPEVPRLFGTLVAPGGNSALLRLDAAQSMARLYMEGERGGAYTVRRILDDRVILDGPSGRIELRLRRGEARP